MASINIFTVQKLAEDRGWKLSSETYKNLQTDLEFECPKGHKVTDNFGNWRRYALCPECLKDNNFTFDGNLPPKSTAYRTLSLDAATNKTGWSIFDSDKLVGYGIFCSIGEDVTERINQVKHWLMQVSEKWKPDLIALEDIQLQKFRGRDGKDQYQVMTYNTLARAQGVNLDTLFELKIPVVIIPSSVWRSFHNIQKTERESYKKIARQLVKDWYGVSVTEDEADSICLGRCAAKKYKKVSIENWE